VAYRYYSLLAVLLLTLCSISGCVQQEKDFLSKENADQQEKGLSSTTPKEHPQEMDNATSTTAERITLNATTISSPAQKTKSNTTTTMDIRSPYQSESDYYRVLEDQKKRRQMEETEEETTNRTKNYLIAKFGRNLFEKSIKFNRSFELFNGKDNVCLTMPFSSYNKPWINWTGCRTRIQPTDDYGDKWIFEYTLNLSRYILSGTQAPVYEVRVTYTDAKKVYCTDNVMDCINHPEYCPPYQINSREKAIESFETYCSRTYNPDMSVTFEFYSNYGALSYFDPNLTDSRFLWHFMEPSKEKESPPLWEVYIDPQTGKPVHDDFFEDKDYYYHVNGRIERFNSTLRGLGIEYRVCKNSL